MYDQKVVKEAQQTSDKPRVFATIDQINEVISNYSYLVSRLERAVDRISPTLKDKTTGVMENEPNISLVSILEDMGVTTMSINGRFEDLLNRLEQNI